MAGHSKWAKLKHSKGLVDAKKASVLTKVSKDIINAVRVGGSADPAFNPMLRVAIDKAKAANMTNDRVERAIKRGSGVSESGDEKIFENTYEAYGPAGVAVLIDTESDNPNRTLTDIKTIINKSGGKIANEGSISWQFKEVGKVVIKAKDNKDSLIEKLMDLEGVVDIEEDAEEIIVIVEKENFRNFINEMQKLQNPYFEIVESKLIKRCDNLIEISESDASSLLELVDKIEDVSEVVGVWTNAQGFDN